MSCETVLEPETTAVRGGPRGDEQDAEEVVQDAFGSVIRKIESFRGASAFGSWLYRIVANAAYQKLRGRQRHRRDLSLDEVLPFFDERGRHGVLVVDWSARCGRSRGPD